MEEFARKAAPIVDEGDKFCS